MAHGTDRAEAQMKDTGVIDDVGTPRTVPPDTAPAVQVVNLWKRYGAVEAVRGVSLDVSKGEIFGLIGPDGAGKTSTFQILGGVMEATSGAAEIFGRRSRDARSQVGYLTQA